MQRALLFLVIFATCACCAARGQDSWDDDFQKSPTPGERTFRTTCAGCHGLDGQGSGKAPNIATSPKVKRLSDAQLANLITNGIPGTSMPAFHTLAAAQVRAVVGFLRALEGRSSARSVSGDARHGRDIFFGKGECSNCHAISGRGGFLGPDLTIYTANASADDMLRVLTTPPSVSNAGYRQAAVTTREGERVEGVVRNEDNFSVQLQSVDGSFHFFQKDDLQNVEYRNQPMMPVDYGKRLSSSELADLISYLIAASSPSKPALLHKDPGNSK